MGSVDRAIPWARRLMSADTLAALFLLVIQYARNVIETGLFDRLCLARGKGRSLFHRTAPCGTSAHLVQHHGERPSTCRRIMRSSLTSMHAFMAAQTLLAVAGKAALIANDRRFTEFLGISGGSRLAKAKPVAFPATAATFVLDVRMALRAVRFSCVLGGNANAAQDIFLVGQKAKVVWVDTRTVATFVVYVQAVRDSAKELLVNKTVGGPLFLVEPKLAVPAAVDVPLPNPTPIAFRNLDKIGKSLPGCLGR